MELSDLWLKMARNENLTPQELDYLRIQGKNTQQNNAQTAGWVNADGTMDLIRPRISSPYFATNALSTITLNRTTDTAITTGTDTAVSFESYYGVETVFSWSSSDPTKIKLQYPGQAFFILGKVTWDANATGYRNVKLKAYSQTGVIGSVVMQSNAGFAGSDNIFPFVNVISQNGISDMTEFEITVGHTKGSDLNLLYADIALLVA